jgi:hypothetical protein
VSAAADGAGEVQLQVAADRTAVTVGDPVLLRVRLVYPRGVTIRSFAPESALQDVTLLDRSIRAAQPLPDGRLEEIRTLKVAAYKPGSVDVPSMEATFIDDKGKEGKVSSAPVTLRVESVLAPGESQPADIKPQAAMPESRVGFFLLLGAAALLLAAWAYWRRRARRPEPVQAAPAAPARPAHEVAYAELERLLSSGWLEQGRFKELYIELAEILKRYLEARFGIDTFERTSSEILDALRLARVPVKATAIAREFFSECDLVKFAKHRPEKEETRATVEKAYRLIDETAPSAPAAPAPTAAAGVRA